MWQWCTYGFTDLICLNNFWIKIRLLLLSLFVGRFVSFVLNIYFSFFNMDHLLFFVCLKFIHSVSTAYLWVGYARVISVFNCYIVQISPCFFSAIKCICLGFDEWQRSRAASWARRLNPCLVEVLYFCLIGFGSLIDYKL